MASSHWLLTLVKKGRSMSKNPFPLIEIRNLWIWAINSCFAVYNLRLSLAQKVSFSILRRYSVACRTFTTLIHGHISFFSFYSQTWTEQQWHVLTSVIVEMIEVNPKRASPAKRQVFKIGARKIWIFAFLVYPIERADQSKTYDMYIKLTYAI